MCVEWLHLSMIHCVNAGDLNSVLATCKWGGNLIPVSRLPHLCSGDAKGYLSPRVLVAKTKY